MNGAAEVGGGGSEFLTMFFCHHSLLLLIETSVCFYFVPSFLTSLNDGDGNFCLKQRCKRDWRWGERLKKRKESLNLK